MYLCTGISCLGGFKFLVLPSSRCPPPEKAWQYILHHSQVMTQHSASTHLKRIVSLHSLPLLVFLHTYTLSHHFVKLQKNFSPCSPGFPTQECKHCNHESFPRDTHSCSSLGTKLKVGRAWYLSVHELHEGQKGGGMGLIAHGPTQGVQNCNLLH